MYRNYRILLAFFFIFFFFSGALNVARSDAFIEGVRYYNQEKYAAAYGVFENLAKRGHVKSQVYLAEMYNFGIGIRRDPKRAALWWRKAADKNHYLSAYNYAKALDSGAGIKPRPKLALKYYEIAAKGNIILAYANMGAIYTEGRGVARDFKKAFEYNQIGARKGDAAAQANLGEAYIWGEGVPKDYDLAMKWSKRAADQEYPPGYMNIGAMYGKGHGVEKNEETAHRYYMMAATRGNAHAQFIVYKQLSRNIGATGIKAKKASKMWLREAARGGLGKAQFLYASNLVKDGSPSKKAQIEAYKWLLISGVSGYEPAVDFALKLKKTLPRDIIDKAGQLAATCIYEEMSKC